MMVHEGVDRRYTCVMPAHENLSRQFGYRGSHQPDTDGDETAIRFHELDKAMPGFYDKPHHYIHSSVSDIYGASEAKQAAMSARGNPEADVTIHRAVPNGVDTINPGDWVSTSRKYAVHHGTRSNLPEGQQSTILTRTAKAKHISFGGNDGYEFGYVGTEPLKSK